MNLLLVSATNSAGRNVSIDRRTGGSGGPGRCITMLFRKSTLSLSRRIGNAGRSSGRSLDAGCLADGAIFSGWLLTVDRGSDGGSFSATEWCVGGGGKYPSRGALLLGLA
jgi:hypothetical protein